MLLSRNSQGHVKNSAQPNLFGKLNMALRRSNFQADTSLTRAEISRIEECDREEDEGDVPPYHQESLPTFLANTLVFTIHHSAPNASRTLAMKRFIRCKLLVPICSSEGLTTKLVYTIQTVRHTLTNYNELGNLIRRYTGMETSVADVVTDVQNQFVVAVGANGTVNVWDGSSAKLKVTASYLFAKSKAVACFKRASEQGLCITVCVFKQDSKLLSQPIFPHL